MSDSRFGVAFLETICTLLSPTTCAQAVWYKEVQEYSRLVFSIRKILVGACWGRRTCCLPGNPDLRRVFSRGDTAP